ncbi:MAG: peptide deformylase [Firmicutes bacterium]|uniref:Peptide deformylase n=1 Tax=Candidatus Gallilactobacillus intestinavium TaxID=2840838 RepID=A0A9D9E8B5_9LACO|nr:peptide deformylase [Candidatus Gallilactobacillus intestinavium]
MFLMENIIRDGNPTLRKYAQKVTFPLSEDNQKLAHKLMEYLEISQNPDLAAKYKLRAGVGLAAPQVNVSLQMASVLVPSDIRPKDPNNHADIVKAAQEAQDHPLFKDVIINPVIISQSVQPAAISEGEGCLSVDEPHDGYVPRADRITLRYQNVDGETKTVKLKGYPAIVCQHEIDHLHGTLFYDHINKENPFKLSDPDTILID